MFTTASFIFSETVSQDQSLCIYNYFYYFLIIIKNLTKCYILNTLAFKNMESLPTIILKNCVFGPWSWHRPLMPMASKWSVLEKSVLGLGLRFFLCRCPWRGTLYSRIHLCYLRCQPMRLKKSVLLTKSKGYFVFFNQPCLSS